MLLRYLTESADIAALIREGKGQEASDALWPDEEEFFRAYDLADGRFLWVAIDSSGVGEPEMIEALLFSSRAAWRKPMQLADASLFEVEEEYGAFADETETPGALTMNLPSPEQFVAQVPALIHSLADTLGLARERLDLSLISLDEVDGRVVLMASSDATFRPESVSAGLIAYAGEVVRFNTRGVWLDGETKEVDATTWEPTIIGENNLLYRLLSFLRTTHIAGKTFPEISPTVWELLDYSS